MVGVNRCGAIVLVAGLVAVLEGPVAAAPITETPAEAARPADTAVRGDCHGFGRMSVTFRPLPDGRSRVVATGVNLPEGSGWSGWIRVDVAGPGGSEWDFGPKTAVDGSWTASRVLSADQDGVGASVVASRHHSRGLCYVVAEAGDRSRGSAWCRQGLSDAAVTVRRDAAGRHVVRFTQGSPDHPGSTWWVAFHASAATGAATQVVEDQADAEGELATRVVFDELDNPQFVVAATGPDDLRCAVAIDPADEDAHLGAA